MKLLPCQFQRIRQIVMSDKNLERYQQTPQEFRKSMCRWLSDPHSGGEVGEYISKQWEQLKLLKVLKKAVSSRLFRSIAVVAVVSLSASLIKRNHNNPTQSLAALLFDNAEAIAITSAGIIFLLEGPERQKRDHYEAWQVINSARGQSGSGGRIQALEDLNRDGVDLEGLSAPRADLSGINLKGASLARANLRKAQLDEAHIEGANLTKANLEGANLQKANLQGAVLIVAHLNSTNLVETNLAGANLTSANLMRAVLGRANLTGADLTGAELTEANLSGANLTGANLSGVSLESARGLTPDQLTQAKLCGTYLPHGINLDRNRDCERIGPH